MVLMRNKKNYHKILPLSCNFSYFNENISCCDPSLESFRRDGSNDQSQHNYGFLEQYGKSSLNYTSYPFLSRALFCDSAPERVYHSVTHQSSLVFPFCFFGSSLLHVPDEKLQQYTCMVIHGCLSGLMDCPKAHQRVVDNAGCWTALLAVVKLCVERECPWG